MKREEIIRDLVERSSGAGRGQYISIRCDVAREIVSLLRKKEKMMPKYIDADAFEESVCRRFCTPCREKKEDYHGVRCRACWVGDMLDEVENAPSADVAPVRHGRWIRVEWVKDEDWQDGGYWILRCSECVMPYHNPTLYCPHCGEKMDGEEDDGE